MTINRLAAVILLAAATAAAAADGPDPKVLKDAKTGLISIEAREAPLSKVMKAFGDRTGLEIRMDDEADTTISANIKNAAPVEAIKLLGETSGLSYAILFRADPKTGGSVPYAVRIIPAGAGSGQSPRWRSPPSPTPPVFTPPERTVNVTPPSVEPMRETSTALSEDDRDKLREMAEERRKAREERDKMRALRRERSIRENE